MRRLIFALALTGCVLTPTQAKTTADAACRVVSAFASSSDIEDVCASAPELVAMAVSILESRQGMKLPAKTFGCKDIPMTSVCASNTERLIAIRLIKGAR